MSMLNQPLARLAMSGDLPVSMPELATTITLLIVVAVLVMLPIELSADLLETPPGERRADQGSEPRT